jgi:signal transduction histidine kinase/CheY-like chemotaxis protein
MEARGLRKDNTEFDVELHMTALESGDVVCTCRDITQRKRTEAELHERSAQLSLANAELARASRLKDEFLAGMSHELRTPLVSILGLTEVLQTDLAGVLNPQQRHYAHTIEESGRHLLQLINDVLDIAKVQAGRVQLLLEPCDLPAQCQSAIRLVRQSALAKGQHLSVSITPPEIQCLADARRLKQILVNLLSNAVKFTPQGGRVGLEVEGDEATHTLRLVVWDTGVGIAAADLPRLFQPFMQVDSSLSRSFGGSGLGLVLVRRMAELHGGRVDVESTPGEGSRFTVVLPWRRPSGIGPEGQGLRPPAAAQGGATAAVAPPAPAGPESPRAWILLVEDNEASLLTFTDFLKAHGYRVDQARNGPEALERVLVVPPDVILLDIQMPGMDGFEVIRRLRKHENLLLRSIPILALTALAMPGDAERCLGAGANAYLAKPIGLADLLAAVERHFPRPELQTPNPRPGP